MAYVPADPAHEPHKVAIYKGDFVDETRGGRIVPVKIYYPTAHKLDHLPVVVWSHGLGGGRDGAAFLARFIASHGYAVVNVQHAGSDTALWEGKPGHPWDIIRATHIPRQASFDRFADISFVLDKLPMLAKAKPEIGEHMNLDLIGMSGHSFGALTTQVLGGQLFPDKEGNLLDLRERRFRAGILYSFMPIGHISDRPHEEIFGPMILPMLFMTGTEDENPINGQGYQYRLPAYEHAGAEDKALFVLEDGDHMVFAGSRGKLEEHPKRHLHENLIKIVSLAWWDAQLKNDRAAAAWLTGDGIKTYLNAEAQFEYHKA